MTIENPVWHPLAHLPAGRILDKTTHDALMDAWIAAGRDLTDEEIQAIVGAPLTEPSIKRDFLTGEYPARRDVTNF